MLHASTVASTRVRLSSILLAFCVWFGSCQQGKDVRETFDKNGKLSQTVEYEHGEPNGKQTLYYATGKVQAVSYIKNGLLDSVSTGYYEEGTPKFIRTYRNGNLEGEYQSFYDNGNISEKGNYLNGVRQGYLLKYFRGEKGKVKEKSYYFDFQGIETKAFTVQYDQDGSIKKTEGSVVVEAAADTVKLNKPTNLEIKVVEPGYTTFGAVLGKYKEKFMVSDSLSLDTLLAKPDATTITIHYTPKEKGLQYVRGAALGSKPLGASRKAIKFFYFEYPLYVVEE